MCSYVLHVVEFVRGILPKPTGADGLADMSVALPDPRFAVKQGTRLYFSLLELQPIVIHATFERSAAAEGESGPSQVRLGASNAAPAPVVVVVVVAGGRRSHPATAH